MPSEHRRPTSPAEAALATAAAEATSQRERLSLHRAKVYRGAPSSPARMRELERACEGAEAHLRQLRSRHGGTHTVASRGGPPDRDQRESGPRISPPG